MIENVGALNSVLAYLDQGEAKHFGEDPNWNHVYLNALVLDEELGANGMKKPIGAWVKPAGDGEKSYIDFSTGTTPFLEFQNGLREGVDGVQFTAEEVVYKQD